MAERRAQTGGAEADGCEETRSASAAAAADRLQLRGNAKLKRECGWSSAKMEWWKGSAAADGGGGQTSCEGAAAGARAAAAAAMQGMVVAMVVVGEGQGRGGA